MEYIFELQTTVTKRHCVSFAPVTTEPAGPPVTTEPVATAPVAGAPAAAEPVAGPPVTTEPTGPHSPVAGPPSPVAVAAGPSTAEKAPRAPPEGFGPREKVMRLTKQRVGNWYALVSSKTSFRRVKPTQNETSKGGFKVGDLFFVESVLEGSSTSGERTLHCKPWSGNRKTLTELVLSSYDLETRSSQSPKSSWHKMRSLPKPPIFPNNPEMLPRIPISKLNETSTMQPTPQPMEPTLLSNFSSTDDMLAAAHNRGYWLHDELGLRRYHLTKQAQQRELSVFEQLTLSSFDISPEEVSLLAAAQDKEYEKLKDEMQNRRDDIDPNKIGTSITNSPPIEVISSKGWNDRFATIECAADALNFKISEMRTAVQFGHRINPNDCSEVLSFRREAPPTILGEQLVLDNRGDAVQSHSCYSTAGRIAFGVTGIQHLRFGRRMSSGGVSTSHLRRYCNGKQVARLILLALQPLQPPNDPSAFQVDHINANCADNRLCNLQWILTTTACNHHSSKTCWERGIGERP